MNRREFVKFLAMCAAAGTAMPEQLAAFENYYEVNVPKVARGLIAIDEIMLCGTARKPTVVKVELLCIGQHEPRTLIGLAINAFGGVMLWRGVPLKELLAPVDEVHWTMEIDGAEKVEFPLTAHVSYVDQDAVRHVKYLTSARGSLV